MVFITLSAAIILGLKRSSASGASSPICSSRIPHHVLASHSGVGAKCAFNFCARLRGGENSAVIKAPSRECGSGTRIVRWCVTADDDARLVCPTTQDRAGTVDLRPLGCHARWHRSPPPCAPHAQASSRPVRRCENWAKRLGTHGATPARS